MPNVCSAKDLANRAEPWYHYSVAAQSIEYCTVINAESVGTGESDLDAIVGQPRTGVHLHVMIMMMMKMDNQHAFRNLNVIPTLEVSTNVPP